MKKLIALTVLMTFSSLGHALVKAQEAKIDQYKNVVLVINDAAFDRELCTGVMLDSTKLLTAAHCFDDGLNKKETSVVFGIDSKGVKYEVADIKIHPQYESDPSFDFAVIKLKKPMVELSKADFISLPQGDEEWKLVTARKTPVTLVGYGATLDDDDLGLSAGVKNIGTSYIASLTRNSASTLYSILLPAKTADAEPRHGDSGGPVFVRLATGEQRLVALTRGEVEDSRYASSEVIIKYVLDWLNAI